MVLIAVACALVVAACGSDGGDDDGKAEKAPTLVLGVAPTMSAAAGMIALEKGYFKDLGVDVKLDNGAAPSNKALPLLAKGDYSIVAMPIDAAVFNAIDRGSLVHLLANYTQDSPDGGSMVGVSVSQKAWDAGATTPEALKGKNIALVAFGGFAEFNTHQALTAGGLTNDDVKFTTMSFGDLVPALANGSVDAGWCSEPLCTQVVEKGIGQRLPVTSNKGHGIYQLFVNADFAEKYPDTVTKALAAWIKAAKELNNGGWLDDDNVAIISKYTKIDPEVIKSVPALQGATTDLLTVTKDSLTPSFELIDEMQEYFRSTDKLTYDKDIDLSKDFDESFIDNALKLVDSKS